MVEGAPVVWVKNKPNAYRLVADQDGTRLEPSESMAVRVVGTVFFLMMASITTLFSLGIYNEAQSVDESPSVSGCWNFQTEIIIGGNPPYCFDGTIRGVIESIEVSEDQHIRERGEDWDGFTYTTEYRWEDVEDSVVYGFIEDERYFCVRFIPEFALSEDWVPADIDAAFEYPDWCGSSVEGQEDRVYEEGAHPYDDVWMYEATDVGAMSFFLYTHKTSESGNMERQYFSKSIIEQDRADRDWGAEVEFGSWALCCTVPITLLFLFAADQRPRVFVVDRQTKTITRRRSGRYPSFSRTWKDVNFPATTVVRSVRQQHHSTAGSSETSPSQHWTTNHSGLNIVIRYGQHQQVLLFFEDGGDVNVHRPVISDFLAAMGLEFQAEQDTWRDDQAALYARPTLEYLAEHNGGVRLWDDQSANFIIGWYYESDPDFIKKYPQAEHDPEFMLEPHGNRPFKEMYRRPLYEGAGLTTVRSTEDAQRLLDHLLALRYPEPKEQGTLESTEQETLPSLEKKAGVDASIAFAPSSSGKDDETVDVDFGRKDDKATGSFWTFDDAQNP